MSNKYSKTLTLRKELLTNWQGNCSSEGPVEVSHISDLIVILGASRSGSSLLHYLFSRHPQIMSLQGEEVTFSKLYGLNEISSFEDSDCLSPRIQDLEKKLSAVANEILIEAGYDTESSTRYSRDICLRLPLQWPDIEFKANDLITASKLGGWPNVIDYLKSKNYPMELAAYDTYFRDLRSNKRLEERRSFIEEPPFIVPRPKSYQCHLNTNKKVLLLKSSINAFRPEVIHKLFPSARLHLVHLTRNPAASINGLMDGWLSKGFHTHNLSDLTTLNIKGYASKKWWKFDLPPGWKEFVHAPLEEVCAFQWHRSNESILQFVKNKEVHRFKYEEYFNLEKVEAFLQKVFSVIGLDTTYAQTLRPDVHVMSVVPPAPYRWKERENIIAPLVLKEEIAQLSSELGYNVLNLREFK